VGAAVLDLPPHVRARDGVWCSQAGAEATPLVDALLDQVGGIGPVCLDIVPAHYPVLPRLFAEGRLPTDVGLVQVAPPGPGGRCSLGIGVDYAGAAVRHSRTLIAEINHRMPVTTGTDTIPLGRGRLDHRRSPARDSGDDGARGRRRRRHRARRRPAAGLPARRAWGPTRRGRRPRAPGHTPPRTEPDSERIHP
jgi:hypothetical protein